MTALRENMPRLADALDALLVVLKDKPTHLRPLIDDKRGSSSLRGRPAAQRTPSGQSERLNQVASAVSATNH
jgi:hypothetical protein